MRDHIELERARCGITTVSFLLSPHFRASAVCLHFPVEHRTTLIEREVKNVPSLFQHKCTQNSKGKSAFWPQSAVANLDETVKAISSSLFNVF